MTGNSHKFAKVKLGMAAVPIAGARRIAVLTSGGDAPGMNAAIRAVVRAGIAADLEVFGVRGGFTGLMAGDFAALGARSVGGIIGRGGTILGTTRCEQLKSEAGQRAALEQMRAHGMSGLIVIGGSGSQRGAHDLSKRGAEVVGVASTIDNDLVGADVSIGATTAVDVALEAIDRLRVTAASHKRVFLVEVMGRDSGHLALCAGISGGAEAVVIPELALDPETLAQEIRASYARGKSHSIVVVAEGANFNAAGLARYFTEHSQRLGFELRTTTLGHIQRGGAPGAFDRLIASRLGAAAVESLRTGKSGVLLGMIDGQVRSTPLSAAAGGKKPLDAGLLELAGILVK